MKRSINRRKRAQKGTNAVVTYRREQKALHGVCMRIKGNKQAKKEDVVVAYGAGQFGSTMKGKRAAPVKKLRKYLR
ncbi:hypothetical protein V1515DRAFT_578200 [Lipomyces mesembrius]